ncbi:MAG: SDR family oxidoreductase [Oscillospiraceae bacterium]|nr:SDR family oxidoreductase [Oscillospiraceae bacterium]
MQNLLTAFSLSGKNALVVGGEHPYGMELIAGLQAAGARVWTAGSAPVDGASGEGFFPYRHANADEAEALAAWAKNAMGTVDVLVENVLNMDTAPGWSHDFDTINAQAQTAMGGMILTVQAVGRVMAAQGHGSVILSTDYGALVGYDPHNYGGCPELYERDFSLLRGYVRGSCVNYARQAAGFLGEHGCRCNALAFAPMAGKQPKSFEEAFAAHSQIKRLATAEDIAAAVTFLASDASAYVTGITLPVDGGYTAK